MPVTGEWYNEEKTIYIYHVCGEWTWEEMISVIHKGWEVTRQVEHIVDVIIDASEAMERVPPGFFSIGTQLFKSRPPNRRYSIIVGVNTQVSHIVRLFIRLNNMIRAVRNVYFVDTIPEALALINASINAESL